jgi:type II secretory pathway component PulF
MSASGFMVANWPVMAAVAIAIIVIIVTFLKTDFGKYRVDKFKTRIPVVCKLINKIYAARFTRSLSSLVAAGVNMPIALEISARTVVNTYLQKALETVVTDVKQGTQLSASFERIGKLPQLVASVTKIGEESGELEDMLIQLADYYDDESDVAIQSLLTMMEPALILTMAGVVVPILFGVLQPMFGMADAVAGM